MIYAEDCLRDGPPHIIVGGELVCETIPEIQSFFIEPDMLYLGLKF